MTRAKREKKEEGGGREQEEKAKTGEKFRQGQASDSMQKRK